MASYKVRKYVDFKNLEGPRKYGIVNASDGLIDKVELANYIAERSGVSVGHVRGLLADMEREIANCLANGETVDLSGIGLINVSIRSEGATTKEGFTVANIQDVKPHLRLRKQFLAALKTIEFNKVKYSTSLPATEEAEEEPLP